MIEEKGNLTKAVILFLLLIAIWGISFMLGNMMNTLRLGYVLLLVLISVFNWGKGIVNYRLCTAVSVLVGVSCVVSWLLNGQPLFYVMRSSLSLFELSAFTIPFACRLNSDQTRRMLVGLSITFCFLYLLQWALYPREIFPMAVAEWAVNDSADGYYRPRMCGSLCAYFLAVYAWNQMLLRNRIVYHGFMAMLGMLPIIIMGFRSLVALSVFSFMMMVPFVTRQTTKTIVATIILCLAGYAAIENVPLVRDKLDEMLARQESGDTFDNDDYARNMALVYYSAVTAQKPIQFVTGGGKPVDEGDNEYSRMFEIGRDFGLYWVDIGLIGLSFIIGIPAVLLLVWLCIRLMWRSKEPEMQYLRFTVFIGFVGTIITSMELFRDENFAFLALYAYLEWRFHEEKALEAVEETNQLITNS